MGALKRQTNEPKRQKQLQCRLLRLQETLRKAAVFVYATIAEKWPPTAHLLAVSQVYIYNGALFFGVVGTEKQFALRT